MAKPKIRAKAPKRESQVKNLMHPPQISMTFHGTKKLRFTTGNVGAQGTFTSANIGNCIVVASSAVAAYLIMETIKIKSIEVWTMSQTLNMPATCSVQFFGGTTNPGSSSRVYTDTSLGSTLPAHVRASPAPGSAAYLWQTTSSSTNLFEVNTYGYSIIDIDFEYNLSSESYSQAAGAALVGATAGVLYGRGLDSLGVGTTTFPMIVGSFPLQ